MTPDATAQAIDVGRFGGDCPEGEPDQIANGNGISIETPEL